jgi:hypothetical protein
VYSASPLKETISIKDSPAQIIILGYANCFENTREFYNIDSDAFFNIDLMI